MIRDFNSAKEFLEQVSIMLFCQTVQVMESYIRSVLNKHDKSGKIYQLNHYTTSVILYGEREQVARQGLKDVSVKIYLNIKSNYSI